jgi:hypothetical protein
MKYLFIIMCLFTTTAYATEKYWHHESVVNNYTTNVYVNEGQIAAAVAMSQQHADWATSDWQGFAGIGRSGSEKALAIGVAKKFCGAGGDCPLLSIGAVPQENSYAIGINFRMH